MNLITTISLTGLTCFTLVACSTKENAKVIPATPLEPMLATTAAPSALPTPDPLYVGDAAPMLSIDHWVKGDKVTKFNTGQVYVVEFWATWCGPCISSMPHLSGIQDEYGNTVKVIAVSSEPKLETVTKFLTKTNRDGKLNNDRMRYTVAVDPDGTTTTAFMTAAGQGGIPTAFIINADGKIAWIGHPMQMDKPLASIVKGTWNLAEATAKFKKGKVVTVATKLKPELKAQATPALKTLAIGDKAPTINVNRWVKGDAVDGFESGKVYILDFWATWCGPCIAAIPHMTEIQKKHGDTVQVIGCAIWQREDTQDARENTVSTFVGKQGDKMGYTVAVDNENWMAENWMKPAGRNGIPSIFVVDQKGRVAWIGHPSSLDSPLQEILDGTWDLAAAAKKSRIEVAAAVEKSRKEVASAKAMGKLQGVYTDAMKTGDYDAWITAIDTFTAEYGDSTQLSAMKFDALLNGKKDKEAAYAWAATSIKSDWDNAQALNAIAWGIVDRTDKELQDLDFALKVAARANELTESKDPAILDTLARIYWERGDKYKAIAWQQKAVESAGDSPMGESIRAALAEYQATLATVETD